MILMVIKMTSLMILSDLSATIWPLESTTVTTLGLSMK